MCDIDLAQSYSIVLINHEEEMLDYVLRDVDDDEAHGVDGDGGDGGGDALELLETILKTIQ